jgi:hypothetical protein
MVKCVVQGCPGRIRLARDAEGQPVFACNECGAGVEGSARRDIEDARKRLAEVREELRRLRGLLGQPLDE